MKIALNFYTTAIILLLDNFYLIVIEAVYCNVARWHQKVYKGNWIQDASVSKFI